MSAAEELVTDVDAWVLELVLTGCAYTTVREQRVVPAEQDEPDGAP